MMVESLPIFYTQRDNLFYSAWAFALPTTLLRIPYSLAESFLWSIIVYWSVGLAPTAARFFTFWLLLFLSHQVGSAFLAFEGFIRGLYGNTSAADDAAAAHPEHSDGECSCGPSLSTGAWGWRPPQRASSHSGSCSSCPTRPAAYLTTLSFQNSAVGGPHEFFLLLCILCSQVGSILWPFIVYWSVVLSPTAAWVLMLCLLLFPSHQVSCVPDMSELMTPGMCSQTSTFWRLLVRLTGLSA